MVYKTFLNKSNLNIFFLEKEVSICSVTFLPTPTKPQL